MYTREFYLDIARKVAPFLLIGFAFLYFRKKAGEAVYGAGGA